MRGLMAVLGALLLAGCSLSDVISRHALDYNDSLETAANTQLVRNILRARDRQPLYFSSVPQIRGALGSGLQLGGVIPFGNQPQNFAAVIPHGFLTSQPSFDVAALDTQEFARGIQQPVDPEVVQFLLDRGLPQQLVLYLLVARIHEPEGRTVTNDPRARSPASSFASSEECRGRGGRRFGEGCDPFQVWVEQRSVGRRLFFNTYIRMTPVSGPLTNVQAGQGEFIAAMQNQGLVTRRENGALRIWRPATQFVLCSEPLRGARSTADANMMGGGAAASLRPRLEAAVQPTRSGTQTVEEGVPPDDLCTRREVFASDFGPEGPPGRPQPNRIPGVQIRSVQEVIGFLGNILNRPDRGADFRFLVPLRPDYLERGIEPCIAGTSLACPSLFQLREQRDAPIFLTVQHDGETLHIARFDEAQDQSTQSLALVDLLLNLYKSASSIPTTRAVQTLR